MGSDPLDQTDLTGSTTNAAFKEYVFFNDGWHTLSAWLSIGWPTLCDFVFLQRVGHSLLRLASAEAVHPASAAVQPSILPIP
jgi:hypothetical protein